MKRGKKEEKGGVSGEYIKRYVGRYGQNKRQIKLKLTFKQQYDSAIYQNDIDILRKNAYNIRKGDA